MGDLLGMNLSHDSRTTGKFIVTLHEQFPRLVVKGRLRKRYDQETSDYLKNVLQLSTGGVAFAVNAEYVCECDAGSDWSVLTVVSGTQSFLRVLTHMSPLGATFG